MEPYPLNNITPKDMKNITGLGLVISHTKTIETFPGSPNFFNSNQPSLIVIYHNGCLAELKTKYGVGSFTPIGNKMYYSCYNEDENCYQIRSVSFDGTDTLIAGEFLEMGPFNRYKNTSYYIDTEKICFSRICDITTFEEGCLIIEQNKGIVRLLKEDGSIEIKCAGFKNPKKILANREGFYVTDILGVHIFNKEKQLFYLFEESFAKYNFGSTIYQLQNKVMLNNDSNDGILVYNTEQKRIVNGLMSRRDFHGFGIGKSMKGFHICPNGHFIVWTSKGIFYHRNKFKTSRLVHTTTNYQNLWNPLAFKMLNISKQASIETQIFLLSMERKSEEFEIPKELCHIILSMASVWEYPNMKLSYL